MGFSELLSGLIGALIATLLSIWYQHSTEEIRGHKYVIIAVNDWLDNVYLRLQLLCGQKEKIYKAEQPTLSEQEYNSMNNEMRIQLLSNKIRTEVECVYRRDSRLEKIISLQIKLK